MIMAGNTLKLRPQSLAEIVTEKLLDLIMDGEIHENEKLNTEELARQLGVSRMPVREAIKSLEKMGLVVSTPYVGAHVAFLEKEDVREIYIGRKALEPVTAYEACRKMTAKEFKIIEGIHKELSDVCESYPLNGKQIFLLNREFHFSIYRVSGYKRLLDMIENLWSNLAFCKLIYSQNYANDYDSAQKMLEEHKSYLEMIRKGEAECLRQNLYDSLSRNERVIPERVAEMLKQRNTKER